jgi:hypothetical protein
MDKAQKKTVILSPYSLLVVFFATIRKILEIEAIVKQIEVKEKKVTLSLCLIN